MSWEQLAAKRVKHLNGQSQPYFSAAEIQAGMQLANTRRQSGEGKREGEARPSATTPSSVSSKAK